MVKADFHLNLIAYINLLLKWWFFGSNNWKKLIKWLLRFFWIIFVGLGFKNITGNIWTAFSYIVILYGSFLVLSSLQEWVICNTTEKIAVKKSLK